MTHHLYVAMEHFEMVRRCISALSAWVLLVGHWEERTVVCQLLGQAQQSGFAVVCVLSAQGSKPVIAVFPPKKATDLNTYCLCC